jgi:hypothetical protein
LQEAIGGKYDAETRFDFVVIAFFSGFSREMGCTGWYQQLSQ